MECYGCLRHVQDKLFDGKTPYERRFVEQFKKPHRPIFSLVEYHPTSPKDQSRIHQFGKKVRGIWKGDILVVDVEELEEMDTSEIHAKRLNAKEVILSKSGDNCKFPVADGTVQNLMAEIRD